MKINYYVYLQIFIILFNVIECDHTIEFIIFEILNFGTKLIDEAEKANLHAYITLFKNNEIKIKKYFFL